MQAGGEIEAVFSKKKHTGTDITRTVRPWEVVSPDGSMTSVHSQCCKVVLPLTAKDLHAPLQVYEGFRVNNDTASSI